MEKLVVESNVTMLQLGVYVTMLLEVTQNQICYYAASMFVQCIFSKRM